MTNRSEYIKTLDAMDILKRAFTPSYENDDEIVDDNMSESTQANTFGEVTPQVRIKIEKDKLGLAAKQLLMKKVANDRRQRMLEVQRQREEMQKNLRELYLKQKEETRLAEIEKQKVELQRKKENNIYVAFNVFFNTSLLVLDLSNLHMKDEDGQLLSLLLFTNDTLRTLDLSNNNLGSKTASEFGLGLCYNTTLWKLNLSGNQLTDNGKCESAFEDFCDFITTNRTLTYLNIEDNNISQNCGTKLKDNLYINFKANKKPQLNIPDTQLGIIELLFNKGNNFTEADVKQISGFVKENNMLKEAREMNQLKQVQIKMALKGKLNTYKSPVDLEKKQMNHEMQNKERWQAAFKVKWAELMLADSEQKLEIMDKIEQDKDTSQNKTQTK